MQIKPAIGSVVGQTDAVHWGQVFLLPNAYGIVEIEDPDNIARQTGVNLLTKITHALADDLKSLKEIETIADSLFIPQCVSMALLVPVGSVVYLVLRGEGTVFLKRGDDIAKLMYERGGISGEVQVGDTILLVSRGFIRVISEEKLASVFDHLTALETAEKLTILLHEQSNGAGSAALVFQVQSLKPFEEDALQEQIRSVAQPRVMETIVKKPVKFVSARHFVRSRLSHVRSAGKRLVSWTKNSRENTALAAVALILLFVISVFLGIRKQIRSKQNRLVANAVSEARYSLDEGVALLELNPVKGRERLKTALSILDSVRTRVPSRSKEGRDITSIYQQIHDNLSLSMHVVNAEPTLFFDMNLLKKGAAASFISLVGDTLGVADQATKTVYTLSVSSKSGKVRAGGEQYEGISFAARYKDRTYVMVEKGIHMVRDSDNQTVELVIKKDKEWGTIASVAAFGGNVYLLDVQKGRIWKYIALEKTFSELREYLNPDTLPDLSSATGMAIDGSVWVGTSSGKIIKFSQGKEQTFTPQGVDPVLGVQLTVYTSDDSKNLYVLDSQNKRVVVLSKDGVYTGQYQWQGSISPSQLVVSEGQKLILLLADGKIYSIELK